MVTLENLQAKISKLQAQAEGIVTKQKSSALEKIRGLMEKHGVTTAEIEAHSGGKRRGRKPGTKVTAKQATSAPLYADPKSGATWSGRGRAPAWIAGAKDRTKFLIDASSQAVTSAAKPTAKATKRVKGPQPAMYVDPKSGATWSGRGRAPAWIATAKDRTKFLIAGANQAVGKENSTSAKKAAPAKNAASRKASPAKKAATRKAVSKRAPAAKKISARKVAAKKAVTSAAVPVGASQQFSEAANAPAEA